ncbi:DoxX family protein [Chlorogloea sp. CCALA 695]|uniref:DoxX family protein n=1 Tax=Chlorogloea sp. CCALA 695 TaxID=2107693 RepID=UPI000D061C40|nr:hypothetical protein [Chlorogloea sp. CCALA 695]PSB29754.1 hypothetical protein C7B70_17700 [Chlorogloea sp. CCALA 695]
MTLSNSTSGRVREILRVVFSTSLIIIGIIHFFRAEQFARIVPPIFPTYPSVYISGVFEILGGIGLLIPSVSVAAAWGLIALFIGVFPANIYMAVHNIKLDGVPQNQLLYWGRLPLQAVLIAWAWWYTKHPKQHGAKAVTGGTKNT